MQIGIIGFGNMGSALGEGLSKVWEVIAFDVDSSKSDRALELGIGWASSLDFLIRNSQFILLAVKPKDAGKVLESLKGKLEDKVLVSIVAGLSLKKIEGILGQEKIIRCMPNLAVVVGKGTMAYTCNQLVSEQEERQFCEGFSQCGSLYKIDEGLMDAFTAIAGSGPAFVMKFISALCLAGVREGFSYNQAKDIVLSTIEGTLHMLKTFGGHPEEWISKVASPAGTTVEGLKVLEESGFSGILMECIRRSTQRSKELG
ncbi:pyrroline-5-carboxylate reductase [Thermocrinis sp.]|uniref:pyrroline-5-carboxylate reductase n=1 Tax=Thermocrinis sp. TaxID=2024383 RepID=UPI002FDCADF9